MASTFAKLNLKEHRQIWVLHAPQTFEPELKALRGITVESDLRTAGPIEFFLAFVTTRKEVDFFGKAIARKTQGDAVVWFAYPKKTSKKYTSELNRDTGWQTLGDAGFEPVRQVAIDDDWSATRFRRAQFIKTLTRGMQHAMSAHGKARAARK